MAWVTLQPGRSGSFEQRWLLLVVGEGDPEMPLLAALRSRKLTKSHICLSRKSLYSEMQPFIGWPPRLN